MSQERFSVLIFSTIFFWFRFHALDEDWMCVIVWRNCPIIWQICYHCLLYLVRYDCIEHIFFNCNSANQFVFSTPPMAFSCLLSLSLSLYIFLFIPHVIRKYCSRLTPSVFGLGCHTIQCQYRTWPKIAFLGYFVNKMSTSDYLHCYLVACVANSM